MLPALAERSPIRKPAANSSDADSTGGGEPQVLLAASADAKAEELLAAYADGLSGADAAAIAAANANWDKAAEHPARCAPYLHHKLAAVDKSPNRKISEMSTEELEAMVADAREELEQLSGEEQALVQDAVTKAVH